MIAIRRKFNAFTLSSKDERITLRLHPDCCELSDGKRNLTTRAQDINLILLEDPESNSIVPIHLGKRSNAERNGDFLTTVSFLDTNYEISFQDHRFVSLRRGYGRFFHIDCKMKSQELNTYLSPLDIVIVLAVCHLSKELEFSDENEK